MIWRRNWSQGCYLKGVFDAWAPLTGVMSWKWSSSYILINYTFIHHHIINHDLIFENINSSLMSMHRLYRQKLS